jgi:ubiquinone/menaquinone biosynthesis C-methylase UbiE
MVDRDITAFEERAPNYDQGWKGRLHHEIADRTSALTVATVAAPSKVLDIGCGTGYLLRSLANQYPRAVELIGIDPAPSMVERASLTANDPRLRFSVAAAEHLPYADDVFDLIVSTTSFDHWADQREGVGECARVLAPDGHLILVDQFSVWLRPTLLRSRREKARNRRRTNDLLTDAGFRSFSCPLRRDHQGRDRHSVGCRSHLGLRSPEGSSIRRTDSSRLLGSGPRARSNGRGGTRRSRSPDTRSLPTIAIRVGARALWP